ncbi:MAG: hypothetical protein FJ295_07950 [Planctomycetes bacterium]|nr:hypothetical protein [Planctomycetota bacterium]
MSVTRRQQIESLLAQQPRDLMLRYMLAMEYLSEGTEERYFPLFRELMADSYVPAYFRAAQQWVAMEQFEEARAALRDGIELARTQGDLKTAAEMGELLASIGRS